MINNLIQIVLIATILIGCGTIPEQVPDSLGEFAPHDLVIDAELKSYYSEFISLCHEFDKEKCLQLQKTLINIVFKSPEIVQDWGKANTLAVCIKYGIGSDKYGQRDVFISEELRADPRLRMAVFHELGHCLLNKEHSKNEESVMYYRLRHKNVKDLDTRIEQMFLDEDK